MNNVYKNYDEYARADYERRRAQWEAQESRQRQVRVRETPRTCVFCGRSADTHAWYIRWEKDEQGENKGGQMIYKCRNIDVVGGRPWSFIDMQTGARVHVG